MDKFKVVSVNVRGVANETKRRALFDYHRFNADLLILQETHSTPDIEQVWENEWGGKIIYSHGTGAGRGIAVCISKELFKKIEKIYRDMDGRTIIFDIIEDSLCITVCAIYAPNKDEPSFFSGIGKLLQDRTEHKIIIGDFNLTLDVEMDRLNTYCNNNKALCEVENLIDEFSLKDIWRIQNPERREFSWMKKGSNPTKASRIDLALVSGGLDQKIPEICYLSSVKTDHRAIYMVIETSPFERGRGYWKFNNSLLQDKQFVEIMNLELQKSIQASSDKQPLERWELIKKRIKKTTIDYSKNKTAEDKLVIGQLSEIVNEYEARLPLNKEEDKMLEDTKGDLEEKIFERIKGVMFRSKAKWYSEGERNTKYFYALEKARYNAKTCYKLINEENQEIDGQQEILEEQKKFYTKLYSEDEDVKFTLNNNTGIHVDENIKKQQDEEISNKDIKQAMQRMKNNKTPGEDGISVDFYKVFWNNIETIFMEMIEYSYSNNTLHQSARQGILNLIPKPGKDSRYIKNLRPITLLNTDYKIIEKAIANKMIPALEQIIHTDQRGFMKNRRISVNIRKMLDIIHEAEKEDLEAIVMSLDFVKCFDKCSFSILHGSLEFFGFGEVVKKWTKILYNDFTVKIQNNGNFSTTIPISKGVHQGGCCSSIYFLVIAEILAISLRSNQDIEGLTIKDIRNLLNQFADDMDIFSKCTEQSIKAIYQELEDFRKQSGFTVSYEKTTLYRIGSLRFSDAQLYNMSEYVWSNKDINVLGVTIAHEDMMEKNYRGIQQKVRNVLQNWNNRGLSLMGRVQVVNTLIASLFVYKMMVLPMIPKNVVKSVDNMIREFLWNGKKAKISYQILQNPKKEGGLNLVNLSKKDLALKATWPIILSEEEEYAEMVYRIMRCSKIKEDIWRCSIMPDDVKNMKIKNQFWEDVLVSWATFNSYHNRRIENQILWYNSRIRVNNKPIMWNDSFTKGLKYVYQLFSGNGFKSENEVWNQYSLTKLRYNSLKTAIPKEWKEFFSTTLRTTYFPIPPHNYDNYTTGGMKNLSQRVYSLVAEDCMLIHNKYLGWRKEIEENPIETLMEYREAFSYIYRITNVTKYRNFQYRLLQRGLVTNIQLHKWGIKPTDMCSFCCQTAESLTHLLIICPVTQQIWNQVFEYLQERFQLSMEKLDTSPKAIIINRITEKISHVANFVCLITKQYIYAQRCLRKDLHFSVLKAHLRKIECLEKYIAIKNNKLITHNRKWGLAAQPQQQTQSQSQCSQHQYTGHEVQVYINEYIEQM